MRGAMMAEFLGLTEAQQADIKKIRTAAREQSQPVRKQLRAKRKALGEAVKAGDTFKIETLASEHGKLQGQLVAIRCQDSGGCQERPDTGAAAKVEFVSGKAEGPLGRAPATETPASRRPPRRRLTPRHHLGQVCHTGSDGLGPAPRSGSIHLVRARTGGE